MIQVVESLAATLWAGRLDTKMATRNKHAPEQVAGIVLGDLVLHHHEQLAAVVDHRIENLAAVGLGDDGAARQRRLWREEDRHEVGQLVLITGAAHRARLGVDARDRQPLQVKVARDQSQPGRVRHGRKPQDYQQRTGELVLVVGLQPSERHEEVQGVALHARSLPQAERGEGRRARPPHRRMAFAA